MVASPSAAAWTARSGGVTSLDACGGGVAVGTATLQGWRDAQEDAHVVDARAPGDGALLLGLFDGHGGAEAAAMAARELGGCAAGATTGDALAAALLSVDGALRRAHAARGGFGEVGCTALAVAVTPSTIAAAWLGDTVGLACRGGAGCRACC